MIANKHLFLIILIFAIASALIIFFRIHFTPVSFGNNLQITNVLLKDWDTLHHTCNIQFDISWDNSWYMASAPGTEAKRDAAWIFAKYAVYSNGKWSSWSHCNLINTGFCG